jgi:hypothetical protein
MNAVNGHPVIRKAERRKSKLRLALCGPSGAGKTYSALQLAFGLGGKVGLIDTEHGSGDLYADLGDYDVITLDAAAATDTNADAAATLARVQQHLADPLVRDRADRHRGGLAPRTGRGLTMFHTTLFAAILAVAAATAASAQPAAPVQHQLVATVDRDWSALFTVDPASAFVVLPRAMVAQMAHAGVFTADDVIDASPEHPVLRLRSLWVRDVTLHDVLATIGEGQDPVLGQSALSRLQARDVLTMQHAVVP